MSWFRLFIFDEIQSLHLCDFGISKHLDGNPEKFAYLAHDEKLKTEQADVYSFGMILRSLIGDSKDEPRFQSLTELATRCTNIFPKNRPTISNLLNELQQP